MTGHPHDFPDGDTTARCRRCNRTWGYTQYDTTGCPVPPPEPKPAPTWTVGEALERILGESAWDRIARERKR